MKLGLFICSIFLFWSCKKQPETVAEFEQWFNVEENGFIRTKTAGNIYIKVQERPTDLMVLSDLSKKTVTDKMIDSLKKGYSNSTYFMIEIGFLSKEKQQRDLITDRDPISYQDYSKLIDQLSFGMEKDVFLIENTDTLKPIMYNYERGYELGKKERMMFMFPKVKGNKKEFVYIDEIFGTGITKFVFNSVGEQPKLSAALFK